MEIVVAGASGRTGTLLVEQALRRGHHVHALARNPAALRLRHPDLDVSRIDVTKRDGIDEAVAGSNAVLSAVGIGTSRERTVVYSAGVANLLAAMEAGGTSRIVVVSAAPAGPRREQAVLERRIVMPILDSFFGATYEDMRRMEAVLGASGADWTSLRPPRLIAKPPLGRYRMSTSGPLLRARSLRFADLATAMLDAAERGLASRTAAYVAN